MGSPLSLKCEYGIGYSVTLSIKPKTENVRSAFTRVRSPFRRASHTSSVHLIGEDFKEPNSG